MSSFFKSIRKGISKMGDYIAVMGPSRVKSFRAALLALDEECAIELYSSREKGRCLMDELSASDPFPLRVFNDQTPMHLAVEACMLKLMILFLERGANPTVRNGRDETVIHSVCLHSDKADARRRLLDLLIAWRGDLMSGGQERISLNHVDREGSSAIHRAALNGLTDCIEQLIAHGAIISLVNKDNKTCCELADDNAHKALADMLELGLVYQPHDDGMREFLDASSGGGAVNSAIYILDSFLMTAEAVQMYIRVCVREAEDILGVDETTAEMVLDAHDWDVTRVKALFAQKQDLVFENARIPSPPRSKSFATSTASKSLLETMHDAISPLKQNLQGIFDDLQSIIDTPQQEVSIVKREEVDLDSIRLGTDEAVVTAPPEEFCSICSDAMSSELDLGAILESGARPEDSGKVTSQCGHAFCYSCWQQYYSMEVREGRGEVIRCPGFKCYHTLKTAWSVVLLNGDEELLRKRQRQREDSVIDRCALIKRCPVNNCGHVLLMSDQAHRKPTDKEEGTSRSSQTVLCGNCHAMCVDCAMEGHAPLSCDLYKCWHSRVEEELKKTGVKNADNGDEIANALWMAANTKSCPRCSSVIEKDEGCNHMCCRSCRHEFCWICMQPWSLHSQRTGGFFQCNRFNEDGEAGGDARSDPRRHQNDTGNAHIEAIRQREAATRTARYIHHYTRFTAHGNSAQLESRMAIDATCRLQNILSRSMHFSDGAMTLNDEAYALRCNSLQLCSGKAKDAVAAEPVLKWMSLQSSFHDPADDLDMSKYPQPIQSVRDQLVRTEAVQKVAVEFLQLGFEELVKCRHFLKSSYVYAFYAFGDMSEFDTEFQLQSKIMNSTGNIFNFLGSNRILVLRKTEYEHIQTELENLTELLSNLVARKRLRASKAQIVTTTDAARAKRLEFESLVHVWALQDAQEPQTSGKRSWKAKSNPLMERFRNFSNLLHSERTLSSIPRQPTLPPRRQASEQQVVPRTRRFQRMNGPYLESSPLSNPVDSEEDTMPGSDMSRLLAALNTVLQMENDDEQRASNPNESNGNRRQPAAESGEVLDPDEELVLAFRLEEEEQINKAILESLRAMPENSGAVGSSSAAALLRASSMNSRGVTDGALSRVASTRETSRRTSLHSEPESSQAVSSSELTPDTETMVLALMSLGFKREQCVAALNLCGQDLDAAANYLMNNI